MKRKYITLLVALLFVSTSFGIQNNQNASLQTNSFSETLRLMFEPIDFEYIKHTKLSFTTSVPNNRADPDILIKKVTTVQLQINATEADTLETYIARINELTGHYMESNFAPSNNNPNNGCNGFSLGTKMTAEFCAGGARYHQTATCVWNANRTGYKWSVKTVNLGSTAACLGGGV